MFEREFEFTVHHPIEVCEERVLDMAEYGCFPQSIFRVSAQVLPVKRDRLTEIYLCLPPRGRFRVEIAGIIEQVNDSTSTVSGVANVIGFPIVIWWSVSLSAIWIFMALYLQGWQLLYLAVFTATLMPIWSWLQFIYLRNRLINRLESALNQPKKKQA